MAVTYYGRWNTTNHAHKKCTIKIGEDPAQCTLLVILLPISFCEMMVAMYCFLHRLTMSHKNVAWCSFFMYNFTKCHGRFCRHTQSLNTLKDRFVCQFFPGFISCKKRLQYRICHLIIAHKLKKLVLLFRGTRRKTLYVLEIYYNFKYLFIIM